MIHPINKHYDPNRKTTTLFFDGRPSMECYMRGGICFPISFEDEQGMTDISGYAVLCGQDVYTKLIWVFEDISWVSIDNIVDQQSNILRYHGLSHWLNKAWSEYFANVFFWQQPYHLVKRHRIQIIRSEMINPKPRFVEVPVTTGNQYMTTDFISAIWEKLKSKTLMHGIKGEPETEIQRQLAKIKMGEKQMFPGVHALGVCIMGFNRYPWRAPTERPIQEVFEAA